MGSNWDQFKYSDAGAAVRKGHIAYDDATVSAKLREAGIPGIKYLDQGSRGAGQGSSNYVVFNDKIIDILKKYGVGSIAALPPAVQAALSQIRPDDQ